MKNFLPKISIITVVYNAENYIKETIESILSQTYDNIEYIIIDGGSTDATLEIIETYKFKITYFKSEKDEGIYDAMNKGIKVSTGEWLNFLNAGDIFAHTNVIKDIFNHIEGQKLDLIYGQIIVRDEQKKEIAIVKPKQFTKFNLIFWGTGTLCHQAMFVSSSFVIPYTLQYKLKGELYWYFELLKKIAKYKIINFPIVYYSLGGTGDVNYKLNHIETFNVMFKQNGIFGILSLPFIVYSIISKVLRNRKKG